MGLTRGWIVLVVALVACGDNVDPGDGVVLGAGTEARLAVAENGVAVAMWRDGSQLRARSFDPGTGWSDEAVVFDGVDVNELSRYQSGFAIADDGQAIAIWPSFTTTSSDANADRGDITFHSARFTPGAGWSAVEVAATLTDQILPWYGAARVAMSPDASALFAFTTGTELYSVRQLPGGGWSAPVLASDNVGGTFYLVSLTLAAGPTGEVFAGWTGSRSPRDPYVARFDPSAGWGDPRSLANISVTTGRVHAVTVAPDGAAIALWGGGGPAFANVYSPAGGWSEAEVVTTGTDWKLAVTPAGRAYALYQLDGFGSIVRFDPAEGWGEGRSLQLGQVSPIPLSNGAGRVIMAWLNQRGEVWSRGLEPETSDERLAEAVQNLHGIGMDGDGRVIVLWRDADSVLRVTHR